MAINSDKYNRITTLELALCSIGPIVAIPTVLIALRHVPESGLLLIAILSTIGIATLNRSLDAHLIAAPAAPEVLQLHIWARYTRGVAASRSLDPRKSHDLSRVVGMFDAGRTGVTVGRPFH